MSKVKFNFDCMESIIRLLFLFHAVTIAMNSRKRRFLVICTSIITLVILTGPGGLILP